MALPTIEQINKARTDARTFADGTPYALDFTVNGQSYTFIPNNVAKNGGVTAGENTYLLPFFTSTEGQKTLSENAIPFNLTTNAGLTNYLQGKGQEPTGFLVPSNKVPFDSDVRTQKTSTLGGSLSGLKIDETGKIAYGLSGGAGSRYLTTSGEVHDPRITYSSFLGDTFGKFGQDIADFVNTDIGKAALLAGSIYAGGGFTGTEGAGAGAGAGAGMGGYDLAMADLAASTPAFTGAEMAAAGGAGGGLFGGTSGAGAGMGGAQGLTMPAAGGGTLTAGGVTGTTPFGGLGAELGTTGLAAGTGSLLTGAAAGAGAGALGAGAAGALTASELGKLGLISGGMNLLGGVLGGQSAKSAAETLAAQQAALAEKTLQMGKFQPVGVTTRFGTSAFTTDPTTGAITPSYTLSPEAKAYQDALAGMATQGLTVGQGLMSLGQQYIGESPEAVRKRYMETQLATLAPAQEQTLAGIRNQLQQTGRGGFATGATSAAGGGLLATSPELAAYYNSLANTQRALAAEAEKQYQGQVNFGQGLLTGAVKPFESAFGAQKAVETAGQQPLGLSMDFSKLASDIGLQQARNYATAMGASYQTQAGANAYNPFATALQGAGSNPLTTYGLMRLIG